jgi:hypothetical protein
MKQAMSLILTLILCLSLCACGNQEKYKKYDTLIGYIEAGDEENATKEFLALLEQNKPETTEPATTTVEITMDNWQDYFELRLVADISRDHFDEVEDTFAKWRLYLKEEYWGKVPEADVAFGYYATEACECNFSYDLDTEILSYSVVQLYSDWQEEGTCGFERSKDYYYAVGEAYIRNYTDLVDRFFTIGDSIQVNDNIVTWCGEDGYLNIEITRVRGTLTLKVE